MSEKFIEDYMVQIGEEQNSMLTRKLHDVNIRLYKNNDCYKNIVRSVVQMMYNILYTNFTNYPSVKGVSGANVGIPFNIIIIKCGRAGWLMINPKIVKKLGDNIEVESNCGSILLDKPIKVLRAQSVVVEYYNLDGNKVVGRFSKENKGFTMQHEIDHNLGITILDRNKEYKDKGGV